MKYSLITVPISMVLASYGQAALAGYGSGTQNCYDPCQGWSVSYSAQHKARQHAHQARLRAQHQARLQAQRQAQQARLRAQQQARARAAAAQASNCGTATKIVISSERRTIKRVTKTVRHYVTRPVQIVEQPQTVVYAGFNDGFVGFGGGSGGSVWVKGKGSHSGDHGGKGGNAHIGGNWGGHSGNSGWWGGHSRPNKPHGSWSGNSNTMPSNTHVVGSHNRGEGGHRGGGWSGNTVIGGHSGVSVGGGSVGGSWSGNAPSSSTV